MTLGQTNFANGEVTVAGPDCRRGLCCPSIEVEFWNLFAAELLAAKAARWSGGAKRSGDVRRCASAMYRRHPFRVV